MTALERRYRRLLMAYPRTYRTAHGDELLDLLLDTADPARTLPEVKEAAGLITGGLRSRAKHAASGNPWNDGLHLGVTALMAANLATLLPYVGSIPIWTALSALALLAVLRGWLSAAMPLVLLTGAKAVAMADGSQLFETTMVPVEPSALTSTALFATSSMAAVAAAYALTFFGLLVLALFGGALRTRSWWWWAAIPVAAWEAPAWVSDQTYVYIPSLSTMILEFGLLCLAAWAGKHACDFRWALASGVYLLAASTSIGQHRLELTQQHLAYWGLLAFLTAVAVIVPYRSRSRRVLR